MAFRFRNSIKIAKGLKLNIGKKGVSFSLGSKGYSLNLGKKGLFANVGLSGTGISYRKKILGENSLLSEFGCVDSLPFFMKVNSLGSVDFYDEEKNLLDSSLNLKIKRRYGEQIRSYLEEFCEEINRKVNFFETIHTHSPFPRTKISYENKPFSVEMPLPPTLKKIGILARIFGFYRRRIEKNNQKIQKDYESQLLIWQTNKKAHDYQESLLKKRFEIDIFYDEAVMQDIIEKRCSIISPITYSNISYSLKEAGKVLLYQVKYEDVDNLSRLKASYSGKGYKVSLKQLNQTQLNRLYAEYVHGLAFLIAGEAFHHLPKVEFIILSGCCSQVNDQTGNEELNFILSVKIDRQQWSCINFENLDEINVISCFEQFETRRDLDKKYCFSSIVPYEIIEK